jgi:hypothetical protein
MSWRVRIATVLLSFSLLSATALAAPAGVVGGWCASTEVDGKALGQWLALAADGTWRRIEDHFGFHAEDRGRWRRDGDDAVFEEADVRLHLADGKLLLSYRGQTLYSFHSCSTIPSELRNLRPFPHTLSETVAILSAELPERQKTVIEGTVERDLGRFHESLGTYVRDHFGLWGNNPALLAACKVEHPEDASDVIIHALRDHLRQTRPGGREIDGLEGLLRGLAIAPLPVRHLTLAQFVTKLNHEVARALRRKGHLEDALVFELPPPGSDEERQQRETYWLNHPSGLRAWGQGERPDAAVDLLDLLDGFPKWLKAPNRVVLQPAGDLKGYGPPDAAPDFASVRWQRDWFEIETWTETSEKGASRLDIWPMLGAVPPMPVEHAIRYASVARERIASGKAPVEVMIFGRSDGDAAWQWSYLVRSALTVPYDSPPSDHVNRDLLARSRWSDLRKPPRLSASQALSRFRSAMAALKGQEASRPTAIHIALRRISMSPSWYYEIELHNQSERLSGYVTMDGRVTWANAGEAE